MISIRDVTDPILIKKMTLHQLCIKRSLTDVRGGFTSGLRPSQIPNTTLFTRLFVLGNHWSGWGRLDTQQLCLVLSDSHLANPQDILVLRMGLQVSVTRGALELSPLFM